MADLLASYRTFLKQELRRRVFKNARYSIRSFARQLGVDNGFLSKLLSGKVLLSLDLAEKIIGKLKLDGDSRKAFILSAAEQRCHAVYLLDPSLTDCDPAEHAVNLLPRTRKAKK